MPEIGVPLSEAQTLVQVILDGSTVDEIVQIEQYPLVDIIGVTASKVECGYTSSECLSISMDYIYRDQPKYNVVAIQAVDNSRNSIVNWLNDGVLVLGESLNDPLELNTIASNANSFYPQSRGLVELTLVDYKTDSWQDQYGYLWSTNSYGPYMVDTIPVPAKDPDKTWSAMTRINSNFADMIIAEQNRALLIFDSSKLISDDNGFFAYTYPVKLEKLNDPKVLQTINIEIQKAEMLLSHMP